MLHRLRQVDFIVEDLGIGTSLYDSYLGMKAAHRSRATDGERAVLHAGNGTFVELWHPDLGEAESSAFRERRGQGPYRIVFQTLDLDVLLGNLRRLGVRHSGVSERPGRRTVELDPAATNGAVVRVVELEQGPNSWPLAGDSWESLPLPRTMCLRQIAILVRNLDRALEQWCDMFQLKATKRFEVSFTELEIAVIPLDDRDTFIELAQPTGPDAPSQRFLDRYGEGLYLTIYQIVDSLAMDTHLEQLGARFTTSRRTENYTNLGFNSIWLHPAGFMGAFTQLSQVFAGDNPWPPAGDDWYLQ